MNEQIQSGPPTGIRTPIAHLTCDRGYFRTAHDRINRFHRLRMALLVAAVMVLSSGFFVVTAETSKDYVVAAIVFFLPLPFFLIRRLWLRWRQFRHFLSRLGGQTIKYDFSDAGLRQRTAQSESALRWSLYSKVAHFDDGFLLFEYDGYSVWFPRESFVDELDWKATQQIIGENVPIHLYVGPVAISRRNPQSAER